jgi:hypothetical protein
VITTLAVRTKVPTMVALGPITRVTGRTTGAIWWPEGLIIKTMLEGTISTGRALALDMLPLPIAREDFIVAEVVAAEVMAVVGVMAVGVTGKRDQQRTFAPNG